MNQKIFVFTMAMLFGSAAAPLAVHANVNKSYSFEPSIVAFDQKAKNGQLTINFAHLPSQGYIAIYKGNENGASGEPIGYTRLGEGEHRGFTVDLKQDVKSGDQLWVAMYKDTDNDPSFKPGDLDNPMWSKSDLPSENMVTIK